MERRENRYVIIDLLDFDVYDIWKNPQICFKSSVGNYENFSVTCIFTTVFSVACVPGTVVLGASDLIDRGYHFIDRPA